LNHIHENFISSVKVKTESCMVGGDNTTANDPEE
jgi:hypothetical protein